MFLNNIHRVRDFCYNYVKHNKDTISHVLAAVQNIYKLSRTTPIIRMENYRLRQCAMNAALFATAPNINALANTMLLQIQCSCKYNALTNTMLL